MCACMCRSTFSNKKNDWRSEGRTGGETHVEFRSSDHKPLSQNPHDSDPFFLETAAQKLSEIQLAQRSAFKQSETDVFLTAQYSLGRVLVFVSFELYCPKIREPVFIQLLQEIIAIE